MGGGLYRALWVDLYGLSQPEAHDKGFGPLVRSSCFLQSPGRVRLMVEERASSTVGAAKRSPCHSTPGWSLAFPYPIKEGLPVNRPEPDLNRAFKFPGT